MTWPSIPASGSTSTSMTFQQMLYLTTFLKMMIWILRMREKGEMLMMQRKWFPSPTLREFHRFTKIPCIH